MLPLVFNIFIFLRSFVTSEGLLRFIQCVKSKTGKISGVLLQAWINRPGIEKLRLSVQSELLAIICQHTILQCLQ